MLFFSVIANIIAVGYVARKVLERYQTKTNNPLPKTAYYLDRDKLFSVLPKDSGAIVFLGNSLTQYFELSELLQLPRIKNRGIHGDMIEGVLRRLAPIISSQPKKLFIEIGINDLEQKVPKQMFLQQYMRLIDTLKATTPQTRIYVQSLLPVADVSAKLPSYCSPRMNRLIVDVNTALKNLALKKNCTYIDVHSQLLQNGSLAAAYSVDGVHLSGEGYLAWTKVIKPFVTE